MKKEEEEKKTAYVTHDACFIVQISIALGLHYWRGKKREVCDGIKTGMMPWPLYSAGWIRRRKSFRPESASQMRGQRNKTSILSCCLAHCWLNAYETLVEWPSNNGYNRLLGDGKVCADASIHAPISQLIKTGRSPFELQWAPFPSGSLVVWIGSRFSSLCYNR